MSNETVVSQAEFDALKQRVDSFEKEHKAFHSSRRGTEGARGPAGPAGENSSVPGPKGADADVQEVIAAAKQEMKKEFDNLHAAVQSAVPQAITQKLQQAGVIDESGVVLIVGQTGAVGAVGARGEKGESVTGAAGKDGVSVTGKSGTDGRHGRDAQIKIGRVSSGDVAAASIREENGVSFLDLVLPRGAAGRDGVDGQSTVGPRGEQGIQGVGKPGNIDAAIHNAEKAARAVVAEHVAEHHSK